MRSLSAFLLLAATGAMGCSDELNLGDAGIKDKGIAKDSVSSADGSTSDGAQTPDSKPPLADAGTPEAGPKPDVGPTPEGGPAPDVEPAPDSAPPPPDLGPKPDGPVAPPAPGIVAYAYANQHTAVSYTPSTTYSYNAGGGAITAKRGSQGVYSITFSGLQITLGQVQVSAYSPPAPGTFCLVASWGSSAVNVRCYDKGGQPADSRYLITVFGVGYKPSAQLIAYAWASKQTTASYTPSALYSYNAGGGAVTAKRSALGAYQITFSGSSFTARGNMMISTYGSKERCVVKSWGGANVNVNCTNTAGAAADARFLLAVADKNASPLAKIRAWAWADKASAASYTPNSSYSFNSGAGAITISRSATGTYAVDFAGAIITYGQVQVTAYSDTRSCSVISFSGSRVNVDCYTANGAKADSRFTVVVIKR